MNLFVTKYGKGRGLTNAYIKGSVCGEGGKVFDVGADIFERGCCLPSDIKMSEEEQDKIIEVIKRCFE